MTRRSVLPAYRTPALLAAASVGGLVAALVGDGFYDWASWLLLGGLVVVTGWAWLRRRIGRSDRPPASQSAPVTGTGAGSAPPTQR